mmetsp:Transcript_45580/g.49233  ORF Transcript_45580/g.49233 Transcript_45580/m.49233 type:complete len:86 (-) Transcript_45580:759-1016(-)
MADYDAQWTENLEKLLAQKRSTILLPFSRKLIQNLPRGRQLNGLITGTIGCLQIEAIVLNPLILFLVERTAYQKKCDGMTFFNGW